MDKVGKNEETSKKLSKKWLYVIGLTIVLGSEFLLRIVFLPKNPSANQVGTAVLIEWLILIFLLAVWIPRVEGNDLRSIGIGRRKWRYLWLGILVYLILFIISIGFEVVLTTVGLEGIRSLQPLLRHYNFPLLLSLFFTGTFLEEIFYRGYLIERVASLTGKTWLAGVISWIAFTFVHLTFFGLGPTLEGGIFSAGLVLVYLKERSVWPCFVVHGINDVFGYIIAPLLWL
jgi:membrane protease YdiL (CAAX protease family)